MIAVIEKATGVAVYLFEASAPVSLTAAGLVTADGGVALDIRPASHALVPCAAPPPGWVAGALTLADGVWGIADEGVYAAVLAGLRARRIAETKAEAGRLIERAMPMWRVARDVSGGVPLTAGEKAAAAALRSASNAIEAWVNDPARSVADLSTMAGCPAWPD